MKYQFLIFGYLMVGRLRTMVLLLGFSDANKTIKVYVLEVVLEFLPLVSFLEFFLWPFSLEAILEFSLEITLRYHHL